MQETVVNIVYMVISTFAIVALTVPFVKSMAEHVGAMDIPNKRKVHKKPMPRLGGISIFMGFLIGYMLFGEATSQMNSILIASFIVVLFGIFDDIKPIRPLVKFAGQLIAACIITFYGNIVMYDISAFGLSFSFGLFSYPITIFFILGCINCMNLIDGLDGLAAGISSIYFATIGIIATIQAHFGLDFLLTFIMLGSTLGFLAYNFNPATIFMGDSGSMFLGLIIAVIALLGFKNVTMTSLIIPLLILAIPILDTLFAILRRLIKGEKISTPDKFHIHHQFLNRNFSQKQTVIIIYLINILFAFVSIVYILKDAVLGYICYTILMVLVLTFVFSTNVIFDTASLRNKLKDKLDLKSSKLSSKTKNKSSSKKKKSNNTKSK